MSNQSRRFAMEEELRPATDPPSDFENDGSFNFTSSFYRIIMSSSVMVLPKKFVEEHGGELSSKIQLDLPVDGGKWYIGLNKSGDWVYLHDGWENFMNYYSIRFEWFLLFKYKGNSVFDVHIFDLKAAEIQYPHHPVSHTNGDAVCKQEFDDAEEIREKQRVVDAAGKMDKTVNPSFSVTLKHYNVHNRYVLNLPITFTRKHMNGCPEFISIVGSNKKICRVRCANYGERRSLGKGWCNFVKEKGLQVGDVCVFELVKKNAILKVDVFYANK